MWLDRRGKIFLPPTIICAGSGADAELQKKSLCCLKGKA